MPDPHSLILMVEDNPDDVLLMRRAFRKAGVKQSLAVVTDGDMAVAYLAGDAPYGDRIQNPLPMLILLDLKLPRRSGMEVLTWVRGHDSFKRLPVVMLTSSLDSGDIDRAYEAGANSYLVKPVQFDDLLRLVKDVETYWFGANIAPTIGE